MPYVLVMLFLCLSVFRIERLTIFLCFDAYILLYIAYIVNSAFLHGGYNDGNPTTTFLDHIYYIFLSS